MRFDLEKIKQRFILLIVKELYDYFQIFKSLNFQIYLLTFVL